MFINMPSQQTDGKLQKRNIIQTEILKIINKTRMKYTYTTQKTENLNHR